MAIDEDLELQGLFLTAPWEAPARRRGDALGLRGLTDRYAESLAPGLSNATIDARWVTLLSWCLKASHEVWLRAEETDLRKRENQRRRYAWLRPLELLWVSWTLQVHTVLEGRQLPGRRAVRKWLDADMQSPRFGMLPAQYRRYRQAGVYGAYRTLLRRIPGMTLGVRGPDGWTPSNGVNALFRYVNAALPSRARFKDAVVEGATRWGSWQEQEERWWMKNGWGADAVRSTHIFPSEGGSAKRLPPEERALLKPYLFPANDRRLLVARLLAEVKPGAQHADLCDHLAAAHPLSQSDSGALLATLPAFTRMADAGVRTMRNLWAAIGESDQASGPEIADLAGDSGIQESLRELKATARGWSRRGDTESLPMGSAAWALASSLSSSTSVTNQLERLVQHHQTFGGGLRWFRLRRKRVEPLLPHGGAPASDYRFRLWPLARLAAQCGVADTRVALEAAGGLGDATLDDESSIGGEGR